MDNGAKKSSKINFTAPDVIKMAVQVHHLSFDHYRHEDVHISSD